MEQSSFKESEDTLSPDEQSRLVGILSGKVDWVVSSGVMTSAEGQAWIKGGWACEQRSHLENLIDIIDSFIASGREKQDQLENLLKTKLLTVAEKSSWRSYFESASYNGKKELLRGLAHLIESVAALEQELLLLLRSRPLSAQQRDSLLNRFYVVSAGSKSAVVNEARSLPSEESLQSPPPKSAQPVAEEAKPLPPVQEERCPTPNPQKRCRVSLELHLGTNQFSKARQILEGDKTLFSLEEYNRLSKAIDRAEIKHIGLDLLAA